jgi:3,2-trans-enoyl-CoA isomerase
MIIPIEHGAVRELRLNRPPVNALSAELIVALRQAIVAAPRDGMRAVILSGSPGRFSGGLDIPTLLRLDEPAMASLWREFYGLLGALARSPIPTAAAITGHAPAGGTVLALFCDWRVMAEGDYRIGLNEVQVGIQLPPILMKALRRLVGPREAEHMAVEGSLLSPEDARRIGLVDEVAPVGQVLNRALEWCQRILALPPHAMSGTRHEARSDLVALFEQDLAAELAEVIASWWMPETQKVLQALAERLGKKKN